MDICLTKLCPEDIAEYKKDIQEAFQKGAANEFCDLDVEILPEADINQSLSAKGAVAYKAVVDGKMLGGAIVIINDETQHNHLDFLYVKYGTQSKGIGQVIWNEIERLHPDTKVWETCTPYFEKRNIHFYINRCGFHAVEFFNQHHKDPNIPDDMVGGDYFFKFEKVMKGPTYERRAKVFSLKQMAADLQYLQENGLMEYAELEQKAAELIDHFHALSDSIKATEAAIRVNAELKAAVVDHAKARPVFEGYKAAKYNKKYLAEHEADIAAYRTVQDTCRRLLSGAKLPKMDTLKAEFQRLSADKKKAYREYRETKKAMQEIVTVKSNIDHLLGLTDAQKNKEMER